MEEDIYKFVFIKSNRPNIVNLIEVVQDVLLPSTYQFYRSNIEFNNEEYDNNNNNNETLLHSNELESDKHYLIQFIETGDFGYWENGVANVFINSIDIENDIYHYFYMQFSL